MRLSKAEKEYLYKILDYLTDRIGNYEVNDFERENLAFPLYLKFKQEVKRINNKT